MGLTLDHVCGKTFHRRKGSVSNAFTYGIDYALVDLSTTASDCLLVSRNAFNVASIFDVDHGGERGNGRGLDWARDVLGAHGLEQLSQNKILLLAQPRFLGRVFNPVCFWLVLDQSENLIAFIAEVNNTFGERHSYLCHHEDLRPISKDDRLKSKKIFHVSPFQPVSGEYSFRLHISKSKIGVWIDYETEKGGVFATFTGDRFKMTSWSIIRSAMRRPFGSARVVALIHWQALKLKIKGAQFRTKPLAPKSEVS